MFMPMGKPNSKGEIWNRVGIMLGLADRSDEIVIGTTERVAKARTVHRMPAGQRRVSEACRGKRILPRRLRLSRWAWFVLSVF